jgi:uncharacterized protein (TIGR02145 family)
VWIFLVLTISSYSQTPGNGVTDIDGNIYNSVIIGAQEWQKENLNVSKYTDGTIIPQVTDQTAWWNLTTGAWCYYNNTTANGSTYGKLYNWYAVAGIYDGASLINPTLRKQLAPTGWHVASDTEWTSLSNFLGGISIAGGKMKEIGTTYWISPNTGATNESNFRGLGAGAGPPFTNSNGQDNLRQATYFWSSTESSSGTSWIRILLYSNSNLVVTDWNKKSGFSVRCLKNSALNNQSFYDNSFNIYPNPTKEYINIDISNLTDTNGWSYKIVNTLGQEVLYGVLSSQQNIVQLNNIKGHGVYFVKIINEQNEILSIKKIILQ